MIIAQGATAHFAGVAGDQALQDGKRSPARNPEGGLRSSRPAQAVADKARELGRACAAVYATLTAKVAAARWAEHPGLWLVGLGCVIY